MDIETTIVQWLNASDTLKDAPASLSVPPDRPERFVTVERTGGMEGPYMATPTIAVQAWCASSRHEAARLAGLVRDRLMTLTGIDEVADVSVESVTHYPDPGPPFAERYQILIQLTVSTV